MEHKASYRYPTLIFTIRNMFKNPNLFTYASASSTLFSLCSLSNQIPSAAIRIVGEFQVWQKKWGPDTISISKGFY